MDMILPVFIFNNDFEVQIFIALLYQLGIVL